MRRREGLRGGAALCQLGCAFWKVAGATAIELRSNPGRKCRFATGSALSGAGGIRTLGTTLRVLDCHKVLIVRGK